MTEGSDYLSVNSNHKRFDCGRVCMCVWVLLCLVYIVFLFQYL